MLDEQAIAGDVIPVDDEAVRRPAFVPADVDAAAVAIAVVGAPDPEMVADDMVAVDFQTGPGVPHGSPADAEEEIGEQCRIVTMIAVQPRGPICTSTGVVCGPASTSSPAIVTPARRRR